MNGTQDGRAPAETAGSAAPLYNAYDVLKTRGFVEQCTHEDELRALLGRERITFYIGYDPTADSLTAGHFLTLMAMSHLQRAGHRPITLMGSGTGMVGDPTDKTEMRRVMPREEVDHNIACFKRQFARFLDYSRGGVVLEDNGEWLMNLMYVPFLRDYGVHFSVNRMLAAETYKARLDGGLTMFEFNYMLMQSYDFLVLYRRHGCRLQVGGNDQWSNIIAGTELIRKTERAETYGLTLTLLTAGNGQKMGKTTGGAVWLDPVRTTPYEFFQYWRNTDDGIVLRNLKLLTYLSLEEIEAMGNWRGAELNRAKEILAYEVTKTVHGQEEADKALAAAKALFAGDGEADAVPCTEMAEADFAEGMNIIDLLEKTGLIGTRSEGRRLVVQGGVKINGVKIDFIARAVTLSDFTEGTLMLQKGRKIYHKVVLA